MPLTSAQRLKVYEIYECPLPETPQVIVTSGGGVSLTPISFSAADTPVQKAIGQAIDRINLDEAKVERIAEILEEYEGFALDPSPIEQDGYKFSARRGLQALRDALFPITGIKMDGSGSLGGVMKIG